MSSFNQFVHELSMESDSGSSVDYSSGEEMDSGDDDDEDDYISPASPSSQTSRFSRASSYTKRQKNWAHWIISIFVWLLLPARLMLAIPLYLYSFILNRDSKSGANRFSGRFSVPPAGRKALDHVVERATDRRRGVIEVCF